MFSFFKKKAPPAEPASALPAPQDPVPGSAPVPVAVPAEAPAERSVFSPSRWFGGNRPATPGAPVQRPDANPTDVAAADTTAAATPAAATPLPSPLQAPAAAPAPGPVAPPAPAAAPSSAERQGWMNRLKAGLRKTGGGIQAVFVNATIDDDLYEQLEDALLMADTGIPAAAHILQDLRDRVWAASATKPAQVRALLVDAVAEVLKPLEKPLEVGRYTPTVIMVAGVNGAGKTTSIGKLTKHLANEGCTVLLAAADTFRAAAREQLAVWADRNLVEIVSQEGGDPAAVSFDAVNAGRARGKDVVLVDTAGRLPTQLHLMDELKKIKRTIAKAGVEPPPGRPKAASAPRPGEAGTPSPAGGSEPRAAGSVGADVPPHEVLLVIDGNTGQNALAQVKAFDDALNLTGLIVTKLDGTAKGGVLCAIAQWGQQRASGPVPVYFIGVGEKLEDLETFDAREFAQALVG